MAAVSRTLSRLVLAIAAGVLCRPGPHRPPRAAIATPADLALLGENSTILDDIIGAPLSTDALATQDESRLASHWVLFALAVECALTDEQSVTVTLDGEETTVQGRYRMWPRWATEPCDEECQEWVSGCMLAKINGYGVPVRLYFSTRRDHPDRQVTDPPETFGYTVQEGAFYGNFFVRPPRMYACRGTGRDPLYDTFRICTHPGSACKIQAVGNCMADGDDEPHACEELDDDGVLRRCHNRLTLPGTGTFPEGSHTYDRLVTTLLFESAMSAGLDADTCFDGPGPDTHLPREPRADVGALSDLCQTDDDCNEPNLICDHLIGAGFCTRGCENTNDPAAEAAACGDEEGVCTVAYDDFERCAKSCRPTNAGGRGCPRGQLCTGFHLYTDFLEEDTGCLPYCENDDDCGGSFCDTSTGSCEEGPQHDEGLVPDGEPCGGVTGAACQGWCVPVHGPQGICGSYINLGDTRTCPDPDMRATEAESDDLALCLYKSCLDDAECTAPLECVGGYCAYP